MIKHIEEYKLNHLGKQWHQAMEYWNILYFSPYITALRRRPRNTVVNDFPSCIINSLWPSSFRQDWTKLMKGAINWWGGFGIICGKLNSPHLLELPSFSLRLVMKSPNCSPAVLRSTFLSKPFKTMSCILRAETIDERSGKASASFNYLWVVISFSGISV